MDNQINKDKAIDNLLLLVAQKNKRYDALKASHTKLNADRNILLCLFGRYGRHDKNCPLSGKYIGGKKCICGFDEAKTAMERTGE